MDVETTGLHSTDRIVSFGGILWETKSAADGMLTGRYTHLVFDPGKKAIPKLRRYTGTMIGSCAINLFGVNLSKRL
jgi:hypothetical protein